ncbi:ParA family protein [Branchiibius sp. NY16-3462-2]|uniref:ParA family protein n=1 Tax=Branchiibius sp. NY16-3462-2 TaxID=1807500 RepID=UPI000AD6808C|nr:AAA family ATPase [Branchiibius sp. NY16-3462-2]
MPTLGSTDMADATTGSPASAPSRPDVPVGSTGPTAGENAQNSDPAQGDLAAGDGSANEEVANEEGAGDDALGDEASGEDEDGEDHALVSRETSPADDDAQGESPSPPMMTTTAASSAEPPAQPEPKAPETPLAARIADEQRRRAVVQRTAVPRPPEPRVMTIANQKGGVGKTTTTVNVAAALAQSGLNVLVIDIDPQGNASTALGIPHHAEVPSIYDVITDDRPLAEVLQECPDIPGLWCAPATIDLAGAEIELVSLVARESRLKRAVDEQLAAMGDDERFDYVLIDCPPSLGLLTVNAFVAAAEVFIPIQCEYYALEGLSQLLNNIGMIRRHLNPRLDVSTILLTMFDARTNLSSNVADEVRAHFPDNVLRTQIPRSVRISEAPSYGQTVLTYDPSSSGALSYLEAAKELALRSAPAVSTA